MFRCPDKYRVTTGPWASPPGANYGAFFVRLRFGEPPLKIIASDGEGSDESQGWEHVSVSLPDRCPTWDEMCKVRDLFWSCDDTVMQLHLPHSAYVNNHRLCLHLWRPTDVAIPTPPAILVGVRTLGTLALRDEHEPGLL